MNLLANIWSAQIWYAVPLAVAICLVYGATRHEHLREIVAHSLRAAMWLVLFLGVIFVLVALATRAV
jgi:hypothetical protein